MTVRPHGGDESGETKVARPEPDIPPVLVGEVAAPFGVRGEVKIVPRLDDPAYLKRLPAVLLQWENGASETRRVLSVRRHQEAFLLTFDGIPDRNAAERLRGARLFVRREQLPPLQEDAYYDWQLVGLRVVTESGRDLGTIEKVHFYPANDVYETPVALIPAIAEVIVEVSPERNELRVRDVPGLRKDET
ncbi:MAG: ribosome maturation factor RimM [Capsulimonadales bacterium]|nr:ribosome maturation factor RimM [Capsulimonadales bacterium]